MGRVRLAWSACLLFVALLAAALAAESSARPALAHALLVSSDPPPNARLSAPPRSVRMVFSEPLDQGFSTAVVLDASGGRVDAGKVTFDAADPHVMAVGVRPNLPPGYYLVSWTSLSKVDGHKLQGSFPLTVLNPDGSEPAGKPPVVQGTSSGGGFAADEWRARWLTLLGAAVLVGAAAYAWLIGRPATRTRLGTRHEGLHTAILGAAAIGIAAGAGVMLAGDLAYALAQAVRLGGFGRAGDFFARTQPGELTAVRMLDALLLGAVGLLLWRRRRRMPDLVQTALLGAVAVLGLLALLTLSAASHGASGRGAFWGGLADWLHLAAATVWLGAVAQLPWTLRARVDLDEVQRARFNGRLLERFALLGVVSVSVVMLTGAFNALVEVGTVSALTSTAYGRALLLKLCLVAALLALAAFNAWWLSPRVRRADSAEAARRLRLLLARSAWAEAGLGAAVLAAVAALVILVPGRNLDLARRGQQSDAVARTVYRNQAPASDLNVQLTVDPNRVGDNRYTVRLVPAAGGQVGEVLRVELRFDFLGAQIGQSTLDLKPLAGSVDTFTGEGPYLSEVGVWQVVGNIRRMQKDDANASFQVEVPDTSGVARVTLSNDPFAYPAKGVDANVALGVALLALGLLPLAWWRRLWTAAPHAGPVATALAVGLVIGGGALVFGVHAHAPASQKALVNPVPADEVSVKRGLALYQANCQVCHGATGHGDGPAAPTLPIRPFDLTVHVPLHPDWQLFAFISEGVGGAMPAWQDRLSEQQRWDLVNYLRTLVPNLSPPSTPPASPSATAVGSPLVSPTP